MVKCVIFYHDIEKMDTAYLLAENVFEYEFVLLIVSEDKLMIDFGLVFE